MASQIKEKPLMGGNAKVKIITKNSDTKSNPTMLVNSIRNSTTLSTYKENEMRIMNDDSGIKESPEIKFTSNKKP